jgi:DnaJ-class molecular chaperone
MTNSCACDNCDGTGKLTLHGPGFDKTGKFVYALEIYQWCPDCEGSGYANDMDEEE